MIFLLMSYVFENFWVGRDTTGLTSFVNDASDQSCEIKFDHLRRLLRGQAPREDVRLPVLGQEQLKGIRVGFHKKTCVRAFINEI